ncbi:MAG: NAD(P)H-hydrate dehydratase [Paludibacter sp.]|nr:NAD(P)H-hydrate dehydratase [Paludibacter sp.]
MQTIDISSQLVDYLRIARNENDNKYDFGHALLVCGKKGMMGAAVLAAKGALRSGCGLLTVHIPENERFILQIACPSAMLSLDNENCFSSEILNLSKFNAIGIGCALGCEEKTLTAFRFLLKTAQKPIVIDADGLNLLAQHPELQKFIPQNSILTPHDGELQRIIGAWKNEEEKLQKTTEFAQKLQINIIAKGSKTKIFSPSGEIFQNTTGNAGMAKAGSGDVLTGFVTGLLARHYAPTDAAVMGVYFHGLAGDRAAKIFGQENMNSEDLINQLKC